MIRYVVAVWLAAHVWAAAAEPALVSDGRMVDPFGRTLYVWDADPPYASLCNAGCATVWPPLTAPVGTRVVGDFAVIVRDDGSLQWAHRGRPLYRLTLDERPGDVYGERLDPAWHAIRLPEPMSSVVVERRDVRIAVRAQLYVDADATTVWSTLSDYDNLARFIPGMTASRALSRSGPEVIVEQKGVVAVGPIHRSFTVLMRVQEDRDHAMTLSAGGGDLAFLQGRYEILPMSPTRTRIAYEGVIVPARTVPAVVSEAMLERTVAGQFNGLAGEIARRARTQSAGL